MVNGNGLSPPAAILCPKPTRVLVPSDQIDKIVQDGDALVGHLWRGSRSQSPPLPPAGVEDVEQVPVVHRGAGAEHAPEAQDAVEGGARLGERSLPVGLPDLLLVVLQRRGNRVLQRTLLQPAVESLQRFLLNQTEAHSVQHSEVVLGKTQRFT